MSDLIASLTPPPNFAKYLYFASAYSVLICTLYLWGYWSTFDINILQYADIAMILKLAALPLLLSLASLAMGGVLGHLTFGSEPTPEERVAAAQSRFGKSLRKHTRAYATAWVALTVVFALIGPTNKWEILPFLITVPIALVLTVNGFAAKIFPDSGVRRAFIFLFVFAIPFSYSKGLRAAQLIETGVRYSYALSAVEGANVKADSSPEVRPRFLGQVSDLLFFYGPGDKSVSIVKFDDKKALTLKRYVAPPDSEDLWIKDLRKNLSIGR